MALQPVVRPPLTAPVIDAPTAQSIRFLHPGYDAPNNVLFRLARVDACSTPENTTTYGVCHATALVACQIVANNAWSGHLARDQDGQALTTAPDEVLLCDEYYFVVPDTPMYPVAPSFRDWPFPHDYIPSTWRSAPSSSHAACSLTDASYSKTIAHLVPREEGNWFKYNSMGQYGHDRKDTEDSANSMHLRADVHAWLDARGWTMVPKATPQGHRYVANVLDPAQAPEFFSWYHNVELRLARQAPEYLFARFAWTVIQLVKPFVISLSPRAVVHVQTDPEKAVKWIVETLPSSQLDKLYGGGRSRSVSPLKRRKSSTRDSSQYNDGATGGASEMDKLYHRIIADQEAQVEEETVERAAQYERAKPGKRRRGSDVAEYVDRSLEEWEGRGRPRKRRSWGTDSTVSSVASLVHDASSTIASDDESHAEPEEGICPQVLSSPPLQPCKVSVQADSQDDIPADIPPERSKGEEV